MLTLPSEYVTLIQAFAPIFSKRIWQHLQVLVIGAILAPGKRTVTAALRIMGLSQDKHFQNYHRILNRAAWSGLEVSRVLLQLLVTTFALLGDLVLGIDDTIERRRGEKIKAKGIYRDPVRSSHSHFVKASGLRWLSLMLLVPIPWAQRVWALPFLTGLAPSERYYRDRVRGQKILTDWVRQMLLQARRWLPKRRLVVVADAGFAVISLLSRMQHLPNPICMVTRFRLDAALYEPAPARQPHQKGRTPLKGKRLPSLARVLKNSAAVWHRVRLDHWYGERRRTVEIASGTAVWYHSGMPVVPLRWVLIRDPKGRFKPQALLCTDSTVPPVQILKWFVLRWRVEVTFQEVRAHLGVETQRQWNDWAILRSTPALLGLFSLVTVLAHRLTRRDKLPVRQAAWYVKRLPTFSDALAVVRQHLWRHPYFPMSLGKIDIQKRAHLLLNRYTDALCYAQ